MTFFAVNIQTIPKQLSGQILLADPSLRNEIFHKTVILAEEAEAYSNQPNTLVRAFAGYSGWGKNQLEDELKEEAWTVVSPTQSILSNPHDITLWKQTMSDISPYHRILAGAPDEILAN